MTRLHIPAEITRRVRDGLTRRFEEGLAALTRDEHPDVGGMVDLAWLLRRMPELSSHRDALVQSLHAAQDPDTGLILNQPEWICWPKALAEVTSTLRVLGAAPRYRIGQLEALAEPDALLAWVRSRNWDHPWGGATGAGHMIAGALFAMDDLGLLSDDALDAVFGVLDSLRDDTHGVWAKGHFDETNPGWPQLGGAYYFGIIYDRFRRPLSRPEGACRMLMEMQTRTPNGSFCFDDTRSWPFASYDHDALYVLTRHSRLDDALRREVVPALERYARYFIEVMRRDEGFTVAYPIPKVLALLRPVFPDPADDVPRWDYQMYKWVF